MVEILVEVLAFAIFGSACLIGITQSATNKCSQDNVIPMALLIGIFLFPELLNLRSV